MSLFPVTSELAVDTSVDSDCGEVTEKEIKEIKPEVEIDKNQCGFINRLIDKK